MILLPLSRKWFVFVFFAALVLPLGDAVAAAKPARAKPARIVSQPAKATGELGGSVVFSVGVQSDSPVSYQWRFNRQPIGGATASSYSISSLTFANKGSYDVVVSNAAGSRNSKAARLDISLAPASLPVGTALYWQMTARYGREIIQDTGSDVVTSSNQLADPEDNSTVSFTYTRQPKNRATLVETGSFYDADFGGDVRFTASYALTFTSVNGSGEPTATVKGRVTYHLPPGNKPAKLNLNFTGTMSVDKPEPIGSGTVPPAPVYGGSLSVSGSTTILNPPEPSPIIITAGTLQLGP